MHYHILYIIKYEHMHFRREMGNAFFKAFWRFDENPQKL